MGLYLGIDGGGTKTEALICDEKGCIIGRGLSGASNPIFMDKDAAFKAIRDSIEQASQINSGRISSFGDNKSISVEDFNYVVICIPGMKKFSEEIKNTFGFKNVTVAGDELNAFYGSIAKTHGIAVLSGTGSFAAAVNKKGESAEIGGWGPILGDEGSGYYIGVCALKAIINEYEDCGKKTILTPMIKEYLNIEDISMLRRIVYQKDFSRTYMGNLCKVVYEAAQKGDLVAIEIIDDAAKQLANLVIKAANKLKMDDGVYEAAITGGVSNLGTFLMEPFEKYVKKYKSNINIINPRFKPVIGSLIVALKNDGINIDDENIMSNFENSYNLITNN